MNQKKEYAKFLKSDQWRNFRTGFLKIHPVCELCGTPNSLHVHHLNYDHVAQESININRSLKWLIVACNDCHYKIHTNKSLWFLDPFGHSKPINRKLGLKMFRKLKT